MGGVWCKADRASGHGPKSTFNSAILRWTDNVRRAYRKPKTHHRPPRPPQKPFRGNEQLIISHPHLATEASADGWRTATLKVPDPAPVPPPRKKRKRNKDIARTAYSMDDLSIVNSFNNSTLSLPEKYHSELGIDSRSSSSTLVVTPVLESRLGHTAEEVNEKQEYNKENIIVNQEKKIEEEPEEEIEFPDEVDVIIPIEKDFMFNTRTILHSNLGYVDKLSAISEVSAESGFDDRTDAGKSSDRSGSLTSLESIPVKDTDLNIVAHKIVNKNNEINKDIRIKTAISKKEWLQNILKEETKPYRIDDDIYKYTNSDEQLITKIVNEPEVSDPVIKHHNNDNLETISDFENSKTLVASTPIKSDKDSANHSVLLELLQNNISPEKSNSTLNPFRPKEESIFMTNTKTNIIYKSLSSDNLTDDYKDYDTNVNITDTPKLKSSLPRGSCEDVSKLEAAGGVSKGSCSPNSTNTFSNSTSDHHLRDYSFETCKPVQNGTELQPHSPFTENNSPGTVSSSYYDKLNENYVSAMKDLQLTGVVSPDNKTSIAVNGVNPTDFGTSFGDKSIETDLDIDKLNTKDSLTKKVSLSSSRRSSITDSLHEFELSIYDMLKESKKNRDSSDEEESLKGIRSEVISHGRLQ